MVLFNIVFYLKVLFDFEDKDGDKVVVGDEWFFEGFGMYIFWKEVEVVEII